MAKIWTLNARDSVLLDVTKSYGGLSHQELGADTRQLHEEMICLLETKDVKYEELRSALVPSVGRTDLALVFDSRATGSGVYGAAVAGSILPALDRGWSGSVLEGDLILHDQALARSLLDASLELVRPIKIRDTVELFAVYLTNLTQARADRLIAAVRSDPAFVGWIPATYESPCKDWLSFTLVNTYVKHRGVFICGHEDDRSAIENVNLHWWPAGEHGYRVVSVPHALYFQLFLSYKIERAVHPSFESDTIHGLSAISGDPRSLLGFEVLVDEARLDYLRKNKAGRLRAAGIEQLSAAELEELIRQRIQSNYIYELEYLAEYDVAKFNIVLEVPNPERPTPARLRVALKYQPGSDTLQVITLY